jgi:hypothetical protein
MSKNNKKQKPYWEMNKRELTEATREFDREFIGDTFGEPPPPKALAQQARAMKKAGRPKIGAGARNVMVSVESNLLAELDEYAKSQNLSRSQVIAQGVRAVMTRKNAIGARRPTNGKRTLANRGRKLP